MTVTKANELLAHVSIDVPVTAEHVAIARELIDMVVTLDATHSSRRCRSPFREWPNRDS